MTRHRAGRCLVGEMKERPIIFSGQMVRAILNGTKTQTRRVINDQAWRAARGFDDGWPVARHPDMPSTWYRVRCPYGVRGNRLWVRETWSHTGKGVGTIGDARDARMAMNGHPVYRADGERLGFSWWPSIHMPSEFSRITLEITGVRVERLQDISHDDALAEGVEEFDGPIALKDQRLTLHQHAFANIWDAVNGKRHPWDSNPWVWVIEFKPIHVSPS